MPAVTKHAHPVQKEDILQRGTSGRFRSLFVAGNPLPLREEWHHPAPPLGGLIFPRLEAGSFRPHDLLHVCWAPLWIAARWLSLGCAATKKEQVRGPRNSQAARERGSPNDTSRTCLVRLRPLGCVVHDAPFLVWGLTPTKRSWGCGPQATKYSIMSRRSVQFSKPLTFCVFLLHGISKLWLLFIFPPTD